MSKGITSRADDYAKWYTDIVQKADLADYSAVRGCMVIKPYGYAIWERMQAELDRMFKDTGHVNAYFPLFIPQSFLAKEASHIEGFALECAVVTHSGLEKNPDGDGLRPKGKLDEPLIVRPTSETIIWNTYKDWIKSWRDLPLLINQWANVVRWEMRTRLFLRTTEFLWQEGHTAHATAEEAEAEAHRMLEVYRTFAEDFMAVPVITGRKSESEKFAGAETTYCIEAMMQDKKALQAGTSHYLGQNFARAFECQFQNKNNELEYVYATSWGVSTRLIGALIMAHSDDKGLVLPPKLAPYPVVIIPIYRKDDEKETVLAAARTLKGSLEADRSLRDVRVKLDDREQYTPGYKFADWELRGAPIRVELGPRDVAAGQVVVVRRDTGAKQTIAVDQADELIVSLLAEIQRSLFDKARAFRDDNVVSVDTYDEFKRVIEDGGFALARWGGSAEEEARIKEETKATLRVIPFNRPADPGPSILGYTADCPGRVIFSKAY